MPTSRDPLNVVIVVVELDVSGPLPVAAHKVLVAWGALVLGVAREHALQRHAHTLDVLDRAPALVAEQVKADDAIRVYVRVHRYRMIPVVGKGDLWRLDGVLLRKPEPEAIGLIEVYRVLVEYPDVQNPLLKVVRRHQRYSWWQSVLDLNELLPESLGRKVSSHGGRWQEGLKS
jgi:hypothetical protein